MDPRASQNQNQIRKVFFSEQNQMMLYNLLTKNFQSRLSSALNEKEASYLERGLEHYMSEVIQQNPNVSIQVLNKESITATASDFTAYLQRQQSVVNGSTDSFQETSQRFDQLLQDRQRASEAPRPVIPDYVQRIPLEEDNSTSALVMFEEAKKKRNLELASQMEAQVAKRSASANQPIYLQDQQQQRPDPRVMFDKPLDLVIAGQESQRELPGRADMNPTIARPGPDASRNMLPQDLIIKQQDIQSYKETEYNLSIYSADRKWEQPINDTQNNENRYNFSVNLFSGNPTNGMSIMPKGSARFKNITRIEFVKAIIPIEGLDIIAKKNSQANSDTDTSLLTTVFSLPFVTLNINELDTNNYGTANTMDNAFGILQYDANWISDTNAGSRGFTSLIPKHLKCQRVYTPTPLATLTKLTVRLQKPDGTIISDIPDTVDVSGIFFSNSVSSYYVTGLTKTTTSYYADTSGEYIWIDTSKWFSRFTAAQGDRILIRGISIPTPSPAQQDFIDFMTRLTGHIIVQTVYSNQSSTNIFTKDGQNSQGYCRFIIIRNQFNDPTTGSTTVKPFGKQLTNATLASYLLTKNFTPGKVLILSHQTELIFRVITRDYDSTSLVRPDNL